MLRDPDVEAILEATGWTPFMLEHEPVSHLMKVLGIPDEAHRQWRRRYEKEWRARHRGLDGKTKG